MKNLNKLVTLSALLLIGTASLSAYAGEKERHLPISTKSEAAKLSYHDALDRIANADINGYNTKIEAALKADPQCFIAHAHRSLAAASNTKNEKTGTLISATLLLPQDNLTPAEKIIRKMLVQIQTNLKNSDKPSIKSSGDAGETSASASVNKTDKGNKNSTALKPLCDELVTTYPNNIEAFETAIAVCRFIDDNPDNAVAYTERLIKIEPNYAPAYNTLGYYWMEKGNMEKAGEAFSNYMRLSPNEANSHDSMGDYLMKSGRFDEAANHYDKAVSLGMESSRERSEKARNMAKGIEPADPEMEK